jgi:hypothetical protein
LMPVFNQPFGYGPAHLAKPQNPDMHLSPPLFDV